MRSLNKSLPKTRRQPDVHQSFRTAALNVTNLYKSALADLDRARTDGYQEALDDLLAFLDKENMGLGDGAAGWKPAQAVEQRQRRRVPRQQPCQELLAHYGPQPRHGRLRHAGSANGYGATMRLGASPSDGSLDHRG